VDIPDFSSIITSSNTIYIKTIKEDSLLSKEIITSDIDEKSSHLKSNNNINSPGKKNNTENSNNNYGNNKNKAENKNNDSENNNNNSEGNNINSENKDNNAEINYNNYDYSKDDDLDYYYDNFYK